ncbi:CYB protein, partial [Acromyrmex heyeri]
IIRNIHINGTSLFFICVYLHIGRNLYYNSFSILLLSITTVFLGYVFPYEKPISLILLSFISTQILLYSLEIAISLIQAYVFLILSTLYRRET